MSDNDSPNSGWYLIASKEKRSFNWDKELSWEHESKVWYNIGLGWSYQKGICDSWKQDPKHWK